MCEWVLFYVRRFAATHHFLTKLPSSSKEIGDVDEIFGYQLNDHKNRLSTHNNGKSRATQNAEPFALGLSRGERGSALFCGVYSWVRYQNKNNFHQYYQRRKTTNHHWIRSGQWLFMVRKVVICKTPPIYIKRSHLYKTKLWVTRPHL